MSYIRYEEWNPSARSLELVNEANAIIGEYSAEGYVLTDRLEEIEDE